jgi:hypothetical protein
MNREEHALKRLLASARKSPRETAGSIPFSQEARILAAWRSSAPGEDLSWMAGSFRRAVILAGIVMVASIGWVQFMNAREVPGAQALSNLVPDVRIVP